MLDRHAVQKLLDAGLKPRAVAEQFRVSRRTIERIAQEAAIRPRADGVLERHRVQALVLDDPPRHRVRAQVNVGVEGDHRLRTRGG
jgi:hypothetical protein